MKIGIATRLDTEQARQIFKRTMNYLLSAPGLAELTLEHSLRDMDWVGAADKEGKESVSENIDNTRYNKDNIRYDELENFNSDVIITIGGDGTILRTIHRTNKRVLPINAGILGFLTELDSDDLETGLGKLLDGDYFIDSRSRLKTVYKDHPLMDAVNEAVIHTAQVAKIRRFRIYVDGFEADTIRADGIIVATPTGTTCYAMSAGSPILNPNVPAITIVPISSFSLSTRPIVVPDSSEIEIRPLDGKESLLVIDGQQTIETDGKESIHFSRSDKKAEFVRFERNFYKRVWKKLIRSST